MVQEEADGPEQEHPGGGRWSRAAALLYLPALAAVLRYTVMAAILLAYRQPAGFYAVPYAFVAFLLGRRALRLALGRDAASPLTDGVLMGAIDLLLAVVYLL